MRGVGDGTGATTGSSKQEPHDEPLATNCICVFLEQGRTSALMVGHLDLVLSGKYELSGLTDLVTDALALSGNTDWNADRLPGGGLLWSSMMAKVTFGKDHLSKRASPCLKHLATASAD